MHLTLSQHGIQVELGSLQALQTTRDFCRMVAKQIALNELSSGASEVADALDGFIRALKEVGDLTERRAKADNLGVTLQPPANGGGAELTKHGRATNKV